MRLFRCAAVVAVVVASLFCSSVSSHADPVPSPSPAAPVAGKPTTAKDFAKRFAKAHPAPTKLAKTHQSTAPRKPSKLAVPDGYSGPVKRLLSDLKNGTLSQKQATVAANEMLRDLTGRSIDLAAKYTGELNSKDLVAVSMLAGTGYQSSLLPVATNPSPAPSQGAMPQGAPSQPSCGFIESVEVCTVAGDNASVVYVPSRLTTAQLVDSDPVDGIPDKAAQTVEALDSAWDYYHDVLGYNGPASGRVWWGWDVVDLKDDRAASLPGGIIVAADTNNIPYLTAHELFHQFQWPYMSWAFPLPSPIPPTSITDPIAIGDAATLLLAAVNLSNIDWWMEGTAEWATTRYANFISEPGHDPRTDIAAPAAGSLGLFFETPSRQLAYGSPVTDTRHYGELAVVDYFAQWIQEDSFVRKTFEKMQGWLYLDGHSQIDNTLNDEYGYATSSMLPRMWHSQYLLCDPADPMFSSGRLSGWWIKSWCGHQVTDNTALKTASAPAGYVARPVHDASSLDAGTANHTVAPGGAWFLDLAGSSNTVDRIKVVNVTTSDPSQTTIWVDSWANTPGEWCGGTEWNPVWDWDPLILHPVAHLELRTSRDCPNTTIAVVNSSLSGNTLTATADWGTFDDGAVISNGTIALGVNTLGGVGVGIRPANEWETEYTGIRDLATEVDLPGNRYYPGDCVGIWQPNWMETDRNRPANGYVTCHGEYGGGRSGQLDLVSFTHTNSEATTIIRSGAAIITQHYHPSANARAYQVDVTVQIEDCAGPQICETGVVYRRLMPVDIDYPPTDENGDQTYWPDYVTYSHDATQTDVIGYTNLTDEDSTALGMIDTLPAPGLASSMLTSADSRFQGFAMDVEIQADTTGLPNPVPQATFYYGVTPTADALTVMNSVGARTYGLITPPEECNEAGLTVFLAH